MKRADISLKTVVIVGLGAVLMLILNRFLAVPVMVLNTYIYFGNAVLALFAAVFGSISGFLIGFIGHALVDLTRGNISWIWVAGSALFGLAVGFMKKLYQIQEGQFGIKQCFIFNCVQIAANLVIWAVIVPNMDYLINRESEADIVYIQGVVIAAVNIVVVLILGSLLVFGFSKIKSKFGK
jgi:energy-coupling factor transport system substrate-specific component